MPRRKRRRVFDELRRVGNNEEGREKQISGKKRKRKWSRDQKCHVTGRDGDSSDCVHAGWGGQTDSPGILMASAPSRKYLGIPAPLHPLPLRCASSPYSTVCLSRAPCWRGASTLSVRQAIYDTAHWAVPGGTFIIPTPPVYPHHRREKMQGALP